MRGGLISRISDKGEQKVLDRREERNIKPEERI